ncbi:DUF106 domain-containing protein [Candidatus Woesearchaeota archaeon]|nr:DUF106 domain-containing protein [Candidatus Woesearchaeota archaeon]
MKKLKDETKEYQKKIKELKNEPARAMEMQKKAMEVNMKYMMHSLKPTIITFIPIILIFGWMSSTFAYESIKPQQEFTVSTIFDKDVDDEIELVSTEELTVVGNKTQKITEKIESGIIFKSTIYKASWELKGMEGEHLLELIYNNKKHQKSVLITSGKRYIEPIKNINNDALKSIQVNYKKLIVLPLGFSDWLGWLGTYIISSIAFTMGLRKLLKVY